MDKINFTAKDSFPASIETLDRLQQATSMVASLALLGGDTYILSGCKEVEGIIEPGIVVIAGEVLPFVGGATLEFIAIEETKQELEAFDELYPEAYINRIAKFTNDGKLRWKDVKRIVTNQELDNKIASLRGEPLGIKLDYTGKIERIPENYMLADGRVLKTVDYPDLAWFYGAELQESFKLPDMKHLFVVGYDPNVPEYSEIGRTGGQKEVTLKEENLADHSHVYSDDTNAMGAFTLNGQSFPTKVVGVNNQDSSAKSGGSGTLYQSSVVGKSEPFDIRPEYFVSAYIIKVKY